ncbi:MAG: hypothetical protein K9G10_05460 [Rhodoluna sp.]|nr:hypothetical protein [Rhodoluna sp.]
MLNRKDLSVSLMTIYVGAVTVGFSYLIGLGTQLGILIPAAFPLGVLLVLLFYWLPARVQLVGWAVATVWLLSSVYLGASDLEYVALIVVVVAAIAGVFWSPWFLAGIWMIHPLWDLVPRDLPEHQHDLPLACLIYDLVIGVYLIFRIRAKFFDKAKVELKTNSKMFSTGLGRTTAALIMLAVIITQILVVGTVSMESYSTWVAAPVALALILSTLWLPREGQKIFWAVLTAWTGMTFAHSGEALEIAIFGLMGLVAVLGFRKSPFIWAGAWAFHALWHFLPREHISHEAALLMGHWMVPTAGAVFELSIAAFLFWFALQEKKAQRA